MHGVLELLVAADRTLTRATMELRFEPANAAFIVLSAWWVKGTLFVAAGGLWDVAKGRRFPVCGLAIAASIGLASLITGVLKETVERLRPPLGMTDLTALGSLPGSHSFPSGHAATAFAAAVALAILVPRLRVAAIALAALVAISRVYLGVHYWFDVIAGAALGCLVGGALALLALQAAALSSRSAAPAGASSG